MEQTARDDFRETDTLGDKLDYMTTAHFFTRVISYLIDIIVLWSVSQIIIYPILNVLDIRNFQLWIPLFSAENILNAIIYFAYFILMTYYFRQTLGKMITGISVVSKFGERLSFNQVIFRELIGRYISNQLFYLPYLIVLFTKDRIGLHDYFANTHVVKNSYQDYKNMIKARYFREV